MKETKFLGFLVKDAMVKKDITFQRLADESGVSKTYLTDITSGGRVPGLKIIEKVANYLEIDLETIREYRVIKLQNLLEKYYSFYDEKDFERMEKCIRPKDLKDNNILSDIKFSKKEYETMEKNYWINLNDLPNDNRDMLFKLYQQFIKK